MKKFGSENTRFLFFSSLAFLGLSLSLIVGLWFFAKPANAQACTKILDRCVNNSEGYFTGVAGGNPYLTFVVEASPVYASGLEDIHNGTQLINKFSDYLFVDLVSRGCPSNATFVSDDVNDTYDCHYAKKNARGVAFVMHVMLGRNGTDFSGVDHGVAEAKTQFNKWRNVIAYYDSQPTGSPNGWVEWDTVRSKFGSIVSSACQRDCEFISWEHDGVPYEYVVFHNSDGTVLEIPKGCANMKDPVPLTSPPPGTFTLEPSAQTPEGFDASNNPSSDDPTRVVFKSTLNSSSESGTGVIVSAPIYEGVRRTFYFQRGASPPVTLTPTSLTPPTNPHQATFGDINFVDEVSLAVVSPLQPGDRICVKVKANPYQGTIDAVGNIATVTTAEKETVPVCLIIANKPYLHVYGGDVRVGDAMAPNCSTPGKGTIKAFNNGNVANPTKNYAGSGGQLGVYAYNSVEGFISASLRSLAPDRPKGLSFANNIPTDKYGGELNKEVCIPDYWATAHDIQTGDRLIGPGPLALMPVGHLVPAWNRREVKYVEGNVSIRTNVIFDTTWPAGIKDIPSLYVIVRGDIFIAPNVTQIDGVYIALPRADGTGGKIYTCAKMPALPNDPGRAYTPLETAEIANNCETQLVVNGAFIAKDVKFLRVKGSLRQAIAGETAGASSAAEVFVGSPETWLGALNDGSISDGTDYDFLNNSAPIL